MVRGVGRETRTQVSKLVEMLGTEEGMVNFREILKRFLQILDEKSVDEITELKNAAIYADLNEKRTEIVAPRFPEGNLTLGMTVSIYSIDNAVYTLLADSK